MLFHPLPNLSFIYAYVHVYIDIYIHIYYILLHTHILQIIRFIFLSNFWVCFLSSLSEVIRYNVYIKFYKIIYKNYLDKTYLSAHMMIFSCVFWNSTCELYFMYSIVLISSCWVFKFGVSTLFPWHHRKVFQY